MKRRLSNRQAGLLKLLPGLLERYSDRKFLETDPVYHVHRYPDEKDQEIVALISALLAFGNVKAIHGSVDQLLQVLGPNPRSFIETFEPKEERQKFQKLGHRWVRGTDLLLLANVLKEILRKYGSIKACFLDSYRSSNPHVGPLLDHFSKTVFSLVRGLEGGRSLSRGFRYFFPSPEDGSPCKRLNMFLRWMVRPRDGIDLGLWTEIEPSKLIIPLDVHVSRFAAAYRLSSYKTVRWETAVQVTDFLKRLDASDPVKFDFPICHYGMEIGW